MERNIDKLSELTDLCSYLSLIGYTIPPDFFYDLFSAMTDTNLADWDLRDMEEILRPMIAKDQKEYELFHQNFQSYFDPESKINKYQKKRQDNKNIQEKLKKDIINCQKKLLEVNSEKPVPILSERKIKNINKRKNINGWLEMGLDEKLDLFHTHVMNNDNITKQELNEIEKLLVDAFKKAVFCKNYEELMTEIKREYKLVRKIKREIFENPPSDKYQRQLQRAKECLKVQQQEEMRLKEEWQKFVQSIKREKSIVHRQEFTIGKNAVRSDSPGELIDKNFKSLSVSEKNQIRQYIRENTKKFRTKLVRNLRSRHAKKIDIAMTCKKSCETDGIPLRLYFKKDHPQRAKVFLLLDVSGSCKDAAEMMLTFAYYMQEAFPGGCHAYAFTNQLYDLSEFMDMGDNMAQTALEKIPRAGAYSNYERPFRQIYEEHLAEIDKDSILVVIGDARNNKNATGEEFFKAISRKAKKVLWMNTDNVEKWDKGDSIISVYAPYIQKIKEVKTPKQLIDFITEV